MATGDITARLTDIHIDRNQLRVTWQATRFQEDSDGTKNSIDAVTVSQDFATQGAIATQTVLQVFQLGVTLVKAASSKMPSTVS